ncbi:MAG: RNA 2',3'-cyclic phosphodiesterase [Firmicutes bacterium]|nr:RNA 2',3'-cyclic phosphodiesterase [Bacillota bacterium]
MPTCRSFIAITLPEEVKSSINQAVRQWRSLADQVKWVPPAQYHLTLAFLGEVSQEQLPIIAEATAAQLVGLPPFIIEINGFGAFPSRNRARVLWLGISKGTDLLQEAYRCVWSALVPLGFSADRSFQPHLTIGRVKTSLGNLVLSDVPAALNEVRASFTVRQIELFKSELFPSGPKYTQLHVMPLLGN